MGYIHEIYLGCGTLNLKLDKIIFHIDVNSAYVSWTAVKQLQYGESVVDIRKIPSIVGGSIADRHGIVLAKSIPAKKFDIKTGEPIFSALAKCPKLKIYPPDYKLYVRCSNAMFELLSEYSPLIQRYSVDEVFLEASHFKEDYIKKAQEIKIRIEKELGFTVNIGISNNKLLAKMASDFNPKDSIHTLFQHEIEEKMWVLPIGDLFMVGRATRAKLNNLNIKTIGDLANYDLGVLKSIFKSYGNVIYNYANGIENSEVRSQNYINIKGISNSITTKKDIRAKNEALKLLLSLTEMVSMRLRSNSSMCKVISLSIKTEGFFKYSNQITLNAVTDSTEEIFKKATEIFDKAWTGDAIRQLGIRLSNLHSNEFYQRTFFDDNKIDKRRALDTAIDNIRAKFGDNSIIRSTFINSDIKPLSGGVGEKDYPMMGSIL